MQELDQGNQTSYPTTSSAGGCNRPSSLWLRSAVGGTPCHLMKLRGRSETARRESVAAETALTKPNPACRPEWWVGSKTSLAIRSLFPTLRLPNKPSDAMKGQDNACAQLPSSFSLHGDLQR